jgi:hypothetical protein
MGCLVDSLGVWCLVMLRARRVRLLGSGQRTVILKVALAESCVRAAFSVSPMAVLQPLWLCHMACWGCILSRTCACVQGSERMGAWSHLVVVVVARAVIRLYLYTHAHTSSAGEVLPLCAQLLLVHRVGDPPRPQQQPWGAVFVQQVQNRRRCGCMAYLSLQPCGDACPNLLWWLRTPRGCEAPSMCVCMWQYGNKWWVARATCRTPCVTQSCVLPWSMSSTSSSNCVLHENCRSCAMPSCAPHACVAELPSCAPHACLQTQMHACVRDMSHAMVARACADRRLAFGLLVRQGLL